jgi:hypothetical protein
MKHFELAAQQNAVDPRFATRANKDIGPARQLQRCGAASFAVKAALELGHGHAALKLDSIHGRGVLPAFAKTPIYPVTGSPSEIAEVCC